MKREYANQLNIQIRVTLRLTEKAHNTASHSWVMKSRKSVRWSAVPAAPKLVYGRGGGERGSGPEGADDLCLVRLEPQGCDLSIGAEI